jgi:hypothetical protein
MWLIRIEVEGDAGSAASLFRNRKDWILGFVNGKKNQGGKSNPAPLKGTRMRHSIRASALRLRYPRGDPKFLLAGTTEQGYVPSVCTRQLALGQRTGSRPKDESGFRAMNRRRFHLLVALLLFVCLVCPFVEMTFHVSSNIFQTGQDNETTLAVLLLLLELAFALPIFLVLLSWSILEKERFVTLHRFLRFASSFAIPLPELSPPLLLRI